MDLYRPLDWILAKAKALQERYYASEYQALAESARRNPIPMLPVRRVSLRNVLIFKPDEIGDAVYSLPAIAALRKELPLAKLILMCTEKTRVVYERSGLLDEIVTVEAKMVLRRIPIVKLSKALDKCSVRRFDAAIFLRTYPGYFHAFKKIKADLRIHPKDPRMNSRGSVQPYVRQWGADRAHQVTQMLQIVAPFQGNIPAADHTPFPKMQWQGVDRGVMKKVFSEATPEHYVVVHPFANYETRRYFYDRWDEILTSLYEKYLVPIVVVGAPGDPELNLSVPAIQMQGKLSLGETGYLTSKASAFFGNESGPAHWASAMGVPTVMVMSGHSAFSEWRPLGKVHVVRKDVECSPCHARSCLRKDLLCLDKIQPDEVWPAIAEFLEHHAKGIVRVDPRPEALVLPFARHQDSTADL